MKLTNLLSALTFVVPSLDEGTEIEAKLYPVPGIGWFALGGGESPTITRYTLSEAGQLEQQDGINLANYGVEGLWDTLYVVSPTKCG